MKKTKMAAKPRLAIISTYDELCGIAGYTRSLVTYLSDKFEIEVFDLDQYLMRATSSSVKKAADEEIEKICAQLSDFDFVNIQLEFGTLGFFQKDILRRFENLVKAAPALSVTFHTILKSDAFPVDAVRHAIFKFELWNTYKFIRDYRRNRDFKSSIYRALKNAQSEKPVNIIVHTQRDAKEMKYLHRFKSVFDHPLSFIPQDQATTLRANAVREEFPSLAKLPKDVKLIGVFGFLSEYKGIHVVLRAMQLLPDNYHLAIFGGLHPQEIRPSQHPHPYVDTLLRETHVGETLVQSLNGDLKSGNITLNLAGENPNAYLHSSLDISKRVHFLGVPSDEDLAKAMAISDIAILPYFEVGQASSGPMSMALEMGAPIIAARNHAFIQFGRYHPNRFAEFEIGNHLELAQKIQACSPSDGKIPKLDYTTNSNLDIYVSANTLPAQ